MILRTASRQPMIGDSHMRILRSAINTFTRLKTSIELGYKISNRKVVLISHSMGSQVMFYFFHWVASPNGGAGGDRWVDEYVDSWINISGCMLGALKDIPTILSGEMKDTAPAECFRCLRFRKVLWAERSARKYSEPCQACHPCYQWVEMRSGATTHGLLMINLDQNVSFGTFLNFKDSNRTHPAKT